MTLLWLLKREHIVRFLTILRNCIFYWFILLGSQRWCGQLGTDDPITMRLSTVPHARWSNQRHRLGREIDGPQASGTDFRAWVPKIIDSRWWSDTNMMMKLSFSILILLIFYSWSVHGWPQQIQYIPCTYIVNQRPRRGVSKSRVLCVCRRSQAVGVLTFRGSVSLMYCIRVCCWLGCKTDYNNERLLLFYYWARVCSVASATIQVFLLTWALYLQQLTWTAPGHCTLKILKCTSVVL